MRAPLVAVLAALTLGFSACTPKKDPEPPKPKVGATEPAPAKPSAPPTTTPSIPAKPSSPVAGLPAIAPAPAWSLKDVNGNVVTSDQFKGKVVVLDFWATWCPPCRSEMPGYSDLQRKYGKDGVAIIGVSVDEGGPKVVKDFIAHFGVNYQIVMADEAMQAAFGGIEAIPTTFLIDRTGQIRDKKVGAEETSEYEKKIAALLN